MRASRAWLACLLLLPTVGCQGDGKAAPPDPVPSSNAAPGMDESLRDGDKSLVNTADVEAAVEADLGMSSRQLTAQALAWARTA